MSVPGEINDPLKRDGENELTGPINSLDLHRLTQALTSHLRRYTGKILLLFSHWNPL